MDSTTIENPVSLDQRGDVETNSGLRLLTRQVPQEELTDLLGSVTFIRLSKLDSTFRAAVDSITNAIDIDVPDKPLNQNEKYSKYTSGTKKPKYLDQIAYIGDWVTIGILAKKSFPKVSSRNTNYMVVELHDLKGNHVNVFIFGKVFDSLSKTPIGTVVGLLNVKVLPAAERNSSVALNVDDEDKWMNIGTSASLGFCTMTMDPKSGIMYKNKRSKLEEKKSNTCGRIINKDTSELCEVHILERYKKSRLNRSEFTSGDALVTLNDPSNISKTRAKQRMMNKKGQGTYSFEKGDTFVAVDGASKVQSIRSCKAGKELTDDQKKEMRALMNSNTAGSRYLQAMRSDLNLQKGKVDIVKQSENMLGSSAIKRMGFNPFK